MRSIAVVSQKGGVGKTTLAVNVSAALAREGHRVLLIDLDPQAHATLHLGIELRPEEPSVYEALVRGVRLEEIARAVGQRLVVIPSAIDLVGAEVELAGREGCQTVLAQALRPYQVGFDFCIIDCAPSLGLLAINALAAAGEVVIPLQPHFLALQGLGRVLETVSLVRRQLNSRLRVSGIVLCMFEAGTRLAQEVRDDVIGFISAAEPSAAWYGARVFSTVIRRNIKLAECPSFGQTIFDYAPTSHGAIDYLALAREIADMDPTWLAGSSGQPEQAPRINPSALTPVDQRLGLKAGAGLLEKANVDRVADAAVGSTGSEPEPCSDPTP